MIYRKKIEQMMKFQLLKFEQSRVNKKHNKVDTMIASEASDIISIICFAEKSTF